MTILERVARAISEGVGLDIPSNKIADIAITAFLEAAAEQGWHMRPDETAKLTYEQRHAAAPEFEWGQ